MTAPRQVHAVSLALWSDRRRFLLRGAAAVAFPMSLVDCGGGDGIVATSAPDNEPTLVVTKTPAKGTIVMPAGATVKIANVTDAFGTSAAAANATFDFTSLAESTTLAIGTGPAGGAVLYGLIQDGAAELSPRSTAVVLAYQFLGVGVYVGDMQVAYLAAIAASPSLDTLQAAVSAAIVARGENWLQTTDTALVAAISGVQQALSVAALTTPSQTPALAPSQLRAQSMAADGRAHAEAIKQDKTDRVSGLQIVNDGVGALTITNYYRRRSYAYVDCVSYKTAYDAAAIASPGRIGAQPMKIAATKAITNTLVTIAEYFAGTTDFYEPVKSDSIPIPLTPVSAALTTYTVTSVGLGGSVGDYGLLSDLQHTGLRQVAAETVLLDFILPILTSILLPARDLHSGGAFAPTTLGEAALSGILKDIADTLQATDDIIINKLTAQIVGGTPPATALATVIWDIVVFLTGRDTFKNAILLFFRYVIDRIGGTPGDLIANGAKKLLDFTAALDLGLTAVDIAVSGLQSATCDVADQFTLDVTKSSVKLNPSNPTVDWPASTVFTLTVIDSDLTPSTELKYHWNCTGAFGDITDGDGQGGPGVNDFDSNQPTLTYAPGTGARRGLGGDQDVVTGQVFMLQVSKRVPLGQATATITYNAAITPSPVQLVINTPQTFTASMSTALLASGTALQYIWTLTGAGSIGASSVVTTTTPSISYTAPANAGTGTLSLKVVDLLNVVRTQGSTTITVLGAVSAGISPDNPLVPQATVLNFVVSSSGASFPEGTTFKWVLTRGPDLFGEPEDLGGSGGGTIGIGISPPASSGPSTGTSKTVVTTTPTITFAANPFGPEATPGHPDDFNVDSTLVLTVTVLNAAGSTLTTSSTHIQTQTPHYITLP